jgi:hypothetical protein
MCLFWGRFFCVGLIRNALGSVLPSTLPTERSSVRRWTGCALALQILASWLTTRTLVQDSDASRDFDSQFGDGLIIDSDRSDNDDDSGGGGGDAASEMTFDDGFAQEVFCSPIWIFVFYHLPFKNPENDQIPTFDLESLQELPGFVFWSFLCFVDAHHRFCWWSDSTGFGAKPSDTARLEREKEKVQRLHLSLFISLPLLFYGLPPLVEYGGGDATREQIRAGEQKSNPLEDLRAVFKVTSGLKLTRDFTERYLFKINADGYHVGWCQNAGSDYDFYNTKHEIVHSVRRCCFSFERRERER